MIVIANGLYDGLHKILTTAGDPIFEIEILDHLGGFDHTNQNYLLEQINDFAINQRQKIKVHISYVPERCFTEKYTWLEFKLDLYHGWQQFQNYNTHPVLTFENFVCSFNGSAHVSRKLLTSALHKFQWFDSNYCSKNFSFSNAELDGHIADFTDGVTGDQHFFYRKFFIDKNQCNEFFSEIYSIDYDRYDHRKNIHTLQHKLCGSFLHLVSETLATSYRPIVSEKFLYSVVTRGLFLAYAQPGWHEHVERHFGFKRYSKLFDYRFDAIKNPVERLVELMSMIAKFSVLSSDDWRDLYEMESETVEYNYDHYFSKKYIKKLEQFS